MDLDNFNLHDFHKADRARLILLFFFKKNFYRATPPPPPRRQGPHSYDESKGRSSLEIAPAPA